MWTVYPIPIRSPIVQITVTIARIIGAAIEVHRNLGPGLLESVYQECLAREFFIQEIPFEREMDVPVEYKGEKLNCGFRIDFLVGRLII